MSAPLPSAEEQAVIDRFEAAPDAEESLRERVAQAIAESDGLSVQAWGDIYYERADAAIAAVRGER